MSTFERRIGRLEEIVGELQRQDIELAAALALFEEGIECLRGASADLAAAQATVNRLVERADGTFDVVPHDV